MKKKLAVLTLAAAVAFSSAACGESGSGSGAASQEAGNQETTSQGAANQETASQETGKQETENKSETSAPADAQEVADAPDNGEPTGDLKEAWEDVILASPVIEGRTVSYGPITMELPEGYVVEDKSSATPTFYAVDALQSEYTPHIGFSGSGMNVFTSDSAENQKTMENQTKKNLEEIEGAEYQGMTSYEETMLGEYHVARAAVSYTYNSMALVCESYAVYEKMDEMGNGVMIEYYGLENDTEHLEAARAAMDSVALLSGAYERGSLVDKISDWSLMFDSASGNALAVEGTKVTYGPLQIDLPEGYTASDETAESPVFYGPDGSSNFSFNFSEDSYYLLSDKNYIENIFTETLSGLGYENIEMGPVETRDINGHSAYGTVFAFDAEGTEAAEAMYIIFESTDELYTPVLTVTYVGGVENAEAIDAACESIKIIK